MQALCMYVPATPWMGVDFDVRGPGAPLVVTTIPGGPPAKAGMVATAPGMGSVVLENLRSSQASCSAENSGLSEEPPSSESAILSDLSGGGANTTQTTQGQGDKQANCCSALVQLLNCSWSSSCLCKLACPNRDPPHVTRSVRCPTVNHI